MSACVICGNDEEPLQEYDLDEGTVEACSDECAANYMSTMRERWRDEQADAMIDAEMERE